MTSSSDMLGLSHVESHVQPHERTSMMYRHRTVVRHGHIYLVGISYPCDSPVNNYKHPDRQLFRDAPILCFLLSSYAVELWA